MPEDDDLQTTMKHYTAMKVFIGLAVLAVVFALFVHIGWGTVAAIFFVWLATKAAETAPECGRGPDWGVPVRSVD